MKKLTTFGLGVVAGLAAVAAAPAAYADDPQFFPMLVYRTGPFAPNGIPSANGMRDFYMLTNKRDGGVGGVEVTVEECETEYNTKLGVECYERLKNKHGGASLVNPYSTGITYQLIPKAPVDEVPVLSMGYGRTSAADGRVFPWVFNFPTTYWSQASAFIRYVGEQEGGMENLKGKKLVHVYLNSAYGKEPIPTFEKLAEIYGYELTTLAVDWPGQEQKATWLQIRKLRPDYVFQWGWGVMNQVAIQEAAAIRFPMDRFIGVWWSGSESDVIPAGDAAKGYKAATFHPAGESAKVHEDILKHIYDGDVEEARKNGFGEVLYNRGLVNAMLGVEAVRTAQARYGDQRMTGAQVRWGLENLDVTEERLEELGFGGFILPIKVTCEDHEGNGPVLIQQWDGEKWNLVSDWIPPIREVVRPMIEEAAAAYAAENDITPRDCSAEG